MVSLLIILGLFVILGFIVGVSAMLTYNKLVKFRNSYQNSFAQVDVQLQRRADLIPNLVESTKGYLNHERETLEAVISARNNFKNAIDEAKKNVGSASAMSALGSSDQVLTGALGRLMVVAEQYPDLKGDQTVASLMEELTSTENKVGFARQAYNDSVLRYNNGREVFPALILAGAFGFERAAFYELPESTSTEAPKVSF